MKWTEEIETERRLSDHEIEYWLDRANVPAEIFRRALATRPLEESEDSEEESVFADAYAFMSDD